MTSAPSELDHLVDAVDVQGGRLVRADPGDLGVGGDQGGRERVGWAVDESASVQGGHDPQSAAAARDVAQGVHLTDSGHGQVRTPRCRRDAGDDRPHRRRGPLHRPRLRARPLDDGLRDGGRRGPGGGPGAGVQDAAGRHRLGAGRRDRPVDRQLDLKAVSAALGAKKASMATRPWPSARPATWSAGSARSARSGRCRRCSTRARWPTTRCSSPGGAGTGPRAGTAGPRAGDRREDRTHRPLSRYPRAMSSTCMTWWAA